MIKISNGVIDVEINENGGCFNSIKKNGEEYLWQGSEDSWTGKDVAIFPFIARLKDGNYLVDGKEYSMKNHGLCRYATLNAVENHGTSATLNLTYSQDTLSQYPFKFSFDATYSLDGNTISIEYLVKNLDDKPIYFGIGAHPAFQIPYVRVGDEDIIDGNYIEFENEINPMNYYLDENGSFITHKGTFGKIKRINLTKDIFKKHKTLMFTDEKFNKVTLHKKDGKNVVMYLNFPKTLAIWTKEKYGGYICIEPWDGIPDMASPIKELSQKDGINKLEKGAQYSFSYKIEL